MEHSKTFIAFSWILRGIAAVILLQTLFFKFTGAKESVYIFSASNRGAASALESLNFSLRCCC